MKKFILLISSCLFVCSAVFSDTRVIQPSAAINANPSITNSIKIGVIDLNKVVTSDPQVSVIQMQIKKKFDPRNQDITKLQKELAADIDKYKKLDDSNKDKSKNIEVEKAQQLILDKQKKLQAMRDDFQRDLMTAQNKYTEEVLKKIERIVNDIASKQKYDLIIAKISTAYNKPELEITDQVIDALKKS
jgi:outer membrane protein